MEKVRPWCGQPSDRGRLKSSRIYRNKPGADVRDDCFRGREVSGNKRQITRGVPAYACPEIR